MDEHGWESGVTDTGDGTGEDEDEEFFNDDDDDDDDYGSEYGVSEYVFTSLSCSQICLQCNFCTRYCIIYIALRLYWY